MRDQGEDCPLSDCRMKPTTRELFVQQGVQTQVARAKASSWQYDWTDCQFGRKQLLLTVGGIAVIGHPDREHKGYKAWAPLPDRDKDAEKRLGIFL